MLDKISYCCFNKQIDCEECERKCEKCGWNPEVKEKRVKEWKREQKLVKMD